MKRASSRTQLPEGPVATTYATAELVRARTNPSQVLLLLNGVESSSLDLADPEYLDFEYMQHIRLILESRWDQGERRGQDERRGGQGGRRPRFPPHEGASSGRRRLRACQGVGGPQGAASGRRRDRPRTGQAGARVVSAAALAFSEDQGRGCQARPRLDESELERDRPRRFHGQGGAGASANGGIRETSGRYFGAGRDLRSQRGRFGGDSAARRGRRGHGGRVSQYRRDS